MLFPRLIISGLAGGTGKTFVSLGLVRALRRMGLSVRGYKKGPDYIDTAWLGLAGKGKASNLDPFMLPPEELRALFAAGSYNADISVIEGNRGYFDGRDLCGSTSTAELAKDLDAPVVLVVDCTKVTRTVAALVHGCRTFPGGERIAGVILNKAARSRHGSLARRAVEEFTDVPVFGVLPRLPRVPILERREGLVTVREHEDAHKALDILGCLLETDADIPALRRLAASAPPLPPFTEHPIASIASGSPDRPRIGVVRDAALWQYYDENLDALIRAGAELVPLSLLRQEPRGADPAATPGSWPPLDGLYLGGGDLAPYAAQLAADEERRREVSEILRNGLPAYAEGAGFLYLTGAYLLDGVKHPMAGLFPMTAERRSTPQGLGYVAASAGKEALYLPPDVPVKGHEFRYEALLDPPPGVLHRALGTGIAATEDGYVVGGTFGALMQIYAPAVPGWAERLTGAARQRKKSRHSLTGGSAGSSRIA